MFLQKCLLFISGEAFIDCVTNCTRLKHWKIKMGFIKFRRNSSRHPDCFLWNFLHAFASRQVVEKIFISKLKTQHISENGSSTSTSSLLPRKKKETEEEERKQREGKEKKWWWSESFPSLFLHHSREIEMWINEKKFTERKNVYDMGSVWWKKRKEILFI